MNCQDRANYKPKEVKEDADPFEKVERIITRLRSIDRKYLGLTWNGMHRLLSALRIILTQELFETGQPEKVGGECVDGWILNKQWIDWVEGHEDVLVIAKDKTFYTNPVKVRIERVRE